MIEGFRDKGADRKGADGACGHELSFWDCRVVKPRNSMTALSEQSQDSAQHSMQYHGAFHSPRSQADLRNSATGITRAAALPRCRLRRGARLPGGARLRGKGPPAAVGCKTSRGRAWQVKSVQVTSGQDMEDQDKSGQVKTGHVT